MLISIIGGVEVVAEVERRGVSTVKNPPILILIKNDDLLTPLLCSSHLFRYLSRRIDPEKRVEAPLGRSRSPKVISLRFRGEFFPQFSLFRPPQRLTTPFTHLPQLNLPLYHPLPAV